MGRLIRWLKVKTRKSRLFIYKNCTPKVQRGVLKDEYKWNSSFFFFSLSFGFFSGSLLLFPSSSFYSHSSFLPTVLLLARFKGILISSTSSPAILWSWKWTFGGVFTVQASYSAFNVAALGEESIKLMWLLHWALYFSLCIHWESRWKWGILD